ncbi:MAG: acyl-CoA thioesterase [Lachnospiraceae bacterium]
MKTATKHLVRPEDLNHHGTLFGGRIAEWMTEAAFIGIAEILGHTDHAVIVSTKELTVRHPVAPGTILQLDYEIEAVGTTSITVRVCGVNMLDTSTEYCRGSFIFVTTDENGHKKAHGICL